MDSFDTQDLCGRLDESRGYNMNTVSGLPVWPEDPRPEDIRIDDIAGALSRICRYNGHLRQDVEHYSVAQHSVLVCRAVAKTTRSPALCLAALLHDAHEYVLGDMVKPQKKMYRERSRYEAKWDIAIAKRFGFDFDLFDHPAVKEADYRMFLTEKRDVIVKGDTDFGQEIAKPYPKKILPMRQRFAYADFLYMFNFLNGE